MVKIEFSPVECKRISKVLEQFRRAIDAGLKKPKKNGEIDIKYLRKTMDLENAKTEAKELKKLCSVFDSALKG